MFSSEYGDFNGCPGFRLPALKIIDLSGESNGSGRARAGNQGITKQSDCVKFLPLRERSSTIFPTGEVGALKKCGSYLSFGNLVTVLIRLAFLRIFASLVSRFDISRLRKSSLCEPGLLASSCLIVALERLIDLTSLVSSIASPRQIKRPAVDVGSIWWEVSIAPLP